MDILFSKIYTAMIHNMYNQPSFNVLVVYSVKIKIDKS